MTKQLNRKPLDVEQKKDHFWWIHPAYRGRQSIDLSHSGMPSGSYKWVRYSEGKPSREDNEDCMPEGEGDYAEFSKTLFKLNNYCPGPLEGWYVVICLEPGRAWAVAQLRADAFTPVQIFEDLIYDKEEDARLQAEAMRDNRPGIRPGKEDVGPYVKKLAEQARVREQKWRDRQARLATNNQRDSVSGEKVSVQKDHSRNPTKQIGLA